MPKLVLANGKLTLIGTSYSDRTKCYDIAGGIWKNTHWEYPIGSILDIVDEFESVKLSPETERLYREAVNNQKLLKALVNGDIPPQEHDFLMRHQSMCNMIAQQFDRFAFFLDTGTGKTILSLQIIEDNLPNKALVVCPKPIIKSAWLEDSRDFYPHLKLLPLSKNINTDEYKEIGMAWGVLTSPNKRMNKYDAMSMLIEHADAFIVNPESFIYSEAKELGVNTLIIDESTRIKNPKAQITKNLTKFADEMKRVYILSGKPAPQSEEDYFSQIRAVDAGVFGSSFHRFRCKYFFSTGFNGYEWVAKPETPDLIAKKLSRISVFIRKEDCIDLPDKTYINHIIELPPKAMEYYKSMEKKFTVKLEDCSVMAQNKVASMMKLRQITAGFLLDDGETRPLHTEKFNELLSILQEIGDRQVLIWCQFKPEIRFIERKLKELGKTVVTAYSETKNQDESIRQFKHGEVQYMIAHPKSIKYGVTFVKCSYAVYYSLSYDFEEYYQTHDRIFRKGQTEPCTFLFLMAEKTIDQLIYNTVVNDKSNRSVAVEDLARYYGRG
jgi:SNF2 family DNA or RNA helicase